MNKLRNHFIIVWLIVALIMVITPARAEEAPSSDYLSLSGRKLNRGLQNAFLGWTELPAGVNDVGNEHGVGAAATWGILHGLGRAIQRTAIGVFEVVTFPVGIPSDFEPIIDADQQ